MNKGLYQKGDKVAYKPDGNSYIGFVVSDQLTKEELVEVELDIDGLKEVRTINHVNLSPIAVIRDIPEDVAHFRGITKRMCELYEKKNTAYGSSFKKSYEKYGDYAPIVRMSDKWERLNNLALCSHHIDDIGERLEDTLLDLANYSIMYLMEIENAKRR